MSKAIRFLVLALVLIMAVGGLSACSLFDNLKKNQTTDDIPQAVVDVFTADENGHFRAQRVFNVNDQLTVDDTTVVYSTVFTFATDGTFTHRGNSVVAGENTAIDKSGTYKVISNLIELRIGDNVDYIDYYSDLIFLPIRLLGAYVGGVFGVSDGVAASQKSATTIGYHIELNVRVGDLPAVFNGEKKTSKGISVPLRQNATAYTSATKGINADQVQGFDSSKAGKIIVDVVISKKTYKAVLNVIA